jgi:Single-strand binding protein family
MSLNRATVIGYLGQDPQLRYTPQGTPVCTLSVATDESYTNKQTGERKEAVEWHRVVVWGKQGSICAEMLAKGGGSTECHRQGGEGCERGLAEAKAKVYTLSILTQYELSYACANYEMG